MLLKTLDRRHFIQILGIGTGAVLLPAVAACSKDKKKDSAEKDKNPGAAGERVAPGKLPETPTDMALGAPDAPVQIVEYASMTCTHCAAFTVGDPARNKAAVFPRIKADYIDTGKVRYILREYPLDPFAAAAFLAMRCAVGNHPDRYFAAADLIFSRQKDWAFSAKDGDEIMNNLADVLKETGLGRAQFNACVTDKTGLERMRAVQKDASEKYKVDATPAFIINGVKYSGELEFDRFEAILNPLLKQG